MHQKKVIEMLIWCTVDRKLSQSIYEEIFCWFLFTGFGCAGSSYGVVWLHTPKVVSPSLSGILKFQLVIK